MSRKRTLINLPLKALTDQSLTLRDIRVLGALESFCDRTSGLVRADRSEIAGRVGIRQEHVSKSTANLEKAGWIEKRGKGCRSNPTQYLLLWLISERTSQDSKGATDGTQSHHEKGATDGTQSHHKKSAEAGTQSPEKDAVDGIQTPAKDATDGTQSAEKGAEAGTQSDDQRAYRDILNINTNTDPDPDSDQTHVGGVINFGQVVEILGSFGTPNTFFSKDKDRHIVKSWIDAGVSESWLREVCSEAKRRKRDANPIGPRYVDMVMTSMAEEKKRAACGGFDGADYRQEF